MKLKTYHAYSMAEALRAVKRDLGADAVILHTRSFKRGGWFGLFRRTVIEVTATPAAAPQPLKNAASPTPSRVRLKNVQAQKAYGNTPTTGKDESSNVSSSKPLDHGQRLTASDRRDVQVMQEQPVQKPEAANSNDDRLRTQRLAMALEEANSRRPMASPPMTMTEPKSEPPSRRHVLAAAPPPAPGRAARRFILTSPDQQKHNRARQQSSDSAGVSDRSTANTHVDETNSLLGSPEIVVRSELKSDPPRVDQMQDELHAIKSMVGQVLQRQVASNAAPSPMMPQQLFDLYLKLIAQEVSSELADQIVNDVRSSHSDEELEDVQTVQCAVRQRLADFIPVAGDALPYAPADGRPLVIAMVGPTGVGKTTTLAKLAATFKLNHGKLVGLITADTYRIAAVDQLRTYADILGLPMHVALTPAEMKRSIQAMSDRDVILIDTAGRSQRDVNRLSELKRFIAAANPHEVHLVLSSTAGEKVLLQEAQAFSQVGVHKIVLTKLDEAVTFGVLVNAMRQIGKQLSYVTTGQEVPDHIEIGSAERLANLVLGEDSATNHALAPVSRSVTPT